MAANRRFSVVRTGSRDLPHEVVDSQRYGDVMARCSSRSVALLLAKALNETRPNLGKDQ